ncbi:MAG: glycoside hydrolase family 5 protein [Melioribacteraceae bacterium]
MKKLLLILLITSVSLSAQTGKAFEINKKIGRGVNIIGYDPIWKNFEHGRFKEAYFSKIKEEGFNSVRINLQAFSFMDKKTNQLSESWFNTLDWAVNNALKNNLTVILDMHNFSDMGNAPAENLPRLKSFWDQVSDHYQNYPDDVIFELLNEPFGKLTDDLWNDYIKELLPIVRRNNPDRILIIGPGFWNNIYHLDSLSIPKDDKNIIVTVHYYLPMEFTHQGASWTPEFKDLKNITWGTPQDLSKVRNDFALVNQWAKKNNRPIYLGEFGVLENAQMIDRIKYLDFITRKAELYNWSWGYWQFDSDFVLYFVDKDEWNLPILDALIPKKE